MKPRRIKFRAYTEISNGVLGMEYDVSHTYNDTVMQFTGFLDRNGTEIYEGDIIRNQYDKKPNQQIIFAKGMFCLDDEDSPLWKCAPQNFWEIVGNIYENKDLIK